MPLSYCLSFVQRSSAKRCLGVIIAIGCLGAAMSPVSAQVPGTPSSGGGRGFELEQNYPNPFNPETTIPFILGEELFADGNPVVVSLRIFNLLSQPVAVPAALGHPAGAGVALLTLEYTQPGRYEAFWDGTDQTGRQVASGIYFMMLTVNAQTQMRRMYVLK